MNGIEAVRLLEDQLQAQLALGVAWRDRAFAARDPRLCSAWIGHFVRISNAMAETGSALARLKHAPSAAGLSLAPLRLPALPPLPDEGEGYPRKSAKQLQGEFRIASKAYAVRFPPPLAGEVDRRAAARR